jgi:hypothetical protein
MDRSVSRFLEAAILRMSKTPENWLAEEIRRFHPCAVVEFDAFALVSAEYRPVPVHASEQTSFYSFFVDLSLRCFQGGPVHGACHESVFE